MTNRIQRGDLQVSEELDKLEVELKEIDRIAKN